MNNEPWWTKLAYIAASAALTSLVAGSVTVGILFASSEAKPLLGKTNENIVSEAYAPLSLQHSLLNEHSLISASTSASSTYHTFQPASLTPLSGDGDSKQIDDAIIHYQQQLAKKDPFQQWVHADTERFPLGPGMHGWFIRVMDKQKQIGYMILQADADGRIRLSEYGLGEQQPFDESTLQDALLNRQQQLAEERNKEVQVTSIYPYQLAPLLTVWRVEWHNGTVDWLDAQSGEWLPLPKQYAPAPTKRDVSDSPTLLSLPSMNQSNLMGSKERLLPASQAVASLQSYREVASPSNLIAPFDPYKNLKWMTKQSITSSKELPLTYRDQNWVYVQRISGGVVNQPFSYIGIQKWILGGGNIDGQSNSSDLVNTRDDVYVIVASPDMKSMRWLPSADALQAGAFIPQS